MQRDLDLGSVWSWKKPFRSPVLQRAQPQPLRQAIVKVVRRISRRVSPPHRRPRFDVLRASTKDLGGSLCLDCWSQMWYSALNAQIHFCYKWLLNLKLICWWNEQRWRHYQRQLSSQRLTVKKILLDWNERQKLSCSGSYSQNCLGGRLRGRRRWRWWRISSNGVWNRQITCCLRGGGNPRRKNTCLISIMIYIKKHLLWFEN